MFTARSNGAPILPSGGIGGRYDTTYSIITSAPTPTSNRVVFRHLQVSRHFGGDWKSATDKGTPAEVVVAQQTRSHRTSAHPLLFEWTLPRTDVPLPPAFTAARHWN
jgi:hypothetical protein